MLLPLSRLLKDLTIRELRGRSDLRIEGLSYDSREVEKNHLFFAIRGFHTDGHRYVDQAIRRGAVGVVHQDDLPAYNKGNTYIRVDNSRESLSKMAAAFFDHPSRDMTVIGVTGTDGKSTTVWFIQQLLEALGESSGFISTVNVKIGDEVSKNPLRQSTPESLEIQGFLYNIRHHGNEIAIIEATSHGLSHKTRRLQDVLFDVGVLTNVTHEHLEFHGSVEQYRSDKANLFRSLGKHKKNRDPFGVLNRDDQHFEFFHRVCPVPAYTYSTKNPDSDLFAENIIADSKGSRFRFRMDSRESDGRLNLTGVFNVEDLMAAVLTVSKLISAPLSELAPHFPRLKGVTGRMESLELGQPFNVIVDYAHTPKSFERLFQVIRSFSSGRIISVFGSAGERDVEKRSLQGRIASLNSEIVILTDEDPRGEEREKILQEIARGCVDMTQGKNLHIIPDRREAIRAAFETAQSGDTVLLLGKGHEESIIYADGPIYWNEIEVARKILLEVIRERRLFQ
jgi:UDP-N-acetylmuramoyl-L-alanyl-D-glutamate--2,6-diaminopimelate ligase